MTTPSDYMLHRLELLLKIVFV